MKKAKDKHQLAVDAFKITLARMKNENQLNVLRDELRDYQRDKRTGNPMDHPRYGLSMAYKAIDERANQLGLIKYPTGYRKPIKFIQE